MRKAWLCGGLAALLAAIPAWADPSIDVGNHPLLGGTAGQTIQIWIAGDGNLAGLDLFVQVGDGGPELGGFEGILPGTPGPSIAGVNLHPAGGIFAGEGNQVNFPGIPQVASSSFDLAHGTVNASGLLANVTIDTTGFSSGTWALMLKGVLPFESLGGPYDTAGVGPGSHTIPIGITNGSISIPAITSWNASSGSWSDGGAWSAGEPNASRRADISNGGTATVSQMGRSCSLLTLGSAPGQSGSVSMTGGALNTGTVYVGYAGTGTFTQSDGNHYVQQALSIATEANSVGAYNLQGGTLFAGRIDVGGSSIGKGGTGSFVVSGGRAVLTDKLAVWSGSTASLGLGGVVNSDGTHPAIDLYNDGIVEVGDGNGLPVVYCLGAVTGEGGIVIGPGATLWVASLEQGGIEIDAGGTLVLAAEDPLLYATIARANYELVVPEPGTLAVMGVGGMWLAGRRGKRTRRGGRALLRRWRGLPVGVSLFHLFACSTSHQLY